MYFPVAALVPSVFGPQYSRNWKSHSRRTPFPARPTPYLCQGATLSLGNASQNHSNKYSHSPIALSTPLCCQVRSKSRVVTTDAQPFSLSAFLSLSSHSGVPFVDTNTRSSLASGCSSRKTSSLVTTVSISIQHRLNAYWALAEGSDGGSHLSGRKGRRFHPSKSANDDIHSQSVKGHMTVRYTRSNTLRTVDGRTYGFYSPLCEGEESLGRESQSTYPVQNGDKIARLLESAQADFALERRGRGVTKRNA